MKHSITNSKARNHNLSRAGKSTLVSTIALLAAIGITYSTDTASAAEKNVTSTTNAPETKAAGVRAADIACTMSHVAASRLHSAAVVSDGRVFAWGSNGSGELGDGSTTARNVPVAVSGLTGATGVAAGDFYTIATKNDGSVWAWGINSHGELGNGTSVPNSKAPVQVKINSTQRLTNILPGAIATGYSHSVALSSDGKVWVWGDGTYGQLGQGNTTSHSYAVQVETSADNQPINAIGVTAGTNTTFVLAADHTVWAWGANVFGQLGDGTQQSRYKPVKVGGNNPLRDIIQVRAGHQHTIALKSDGTVYTWGRNASGELGGGFKSDFRYTPGIVKMQDGGNLDNVIAIAGGGSGYATMVLRGDGTLWSWGDDDSLQLGTADNSDHIFPKPVVKSYNNRLTGIRSVSFGFVHAVALANDGSLWSWGTNFEGQLGLGHNTAQEYAKKLNLSYLVDANAQAPICSGGTWVNPPVNGCAIDGNSYTQGQANPSNPCQICNSLNLNTIWSNASEGTACTDDGLAWTDDKCNQNGECTHVPNSKCEINGVVYANGTPNPYNSCLVCNSSLSHTSWSNAVVGTQCDADAYFCTQDTCDGSGLCKHYVMSNYCLIGTSCVAVGNQQPGNACMECNPSLTSGAYSPASTGSDCQDDGNPATLDVCDSSGQCTHPSSGKCRIDGVYYNTGDKKSGDDCLVCDPIANYYGWTRSVEGICNGCRSDAECSFPTPVCNISSGECVSCMLDTDCFFPTPVCNSQHTCVSCRTNADCSFPTPVCGLNDECVGCETNADCSAPTPVCSPSHECVGCVSNSDCAVPTPICASNNECVGCITDSNCAAPTPACSNNHECVECTTQNITQCKPGMGCIADENICQNCHSNSDCSYPTPMCNLSGECVGCKTDSDCSGSTPACSSWGECVECKSDAYCHAPTPSCNTTGDCVQCQNDSQCSSPTPSCNSEGECFGCRTDDDCALPTPACASSGKCVECHQNADCPVSTPVCDNKGTCSRCHVDLDCSDPTPLCGNEGNCVECRSSADCSGNRPVCDASGSCVACTSKTDCAPPTPTCSATGECIGCKSNADCSGTTPACDIATGECVACRSDSDCSVPTPACSASGECVECTAANQTQCDPELGCIVSKEKCAGCKTDSDCAAPKPACTSEGECVECTESNVTQCRDGLDCIVEKNVCEQCKTDDDCSASTPACSAAGECVECSATNSQLCENGDVCLVNEGICGGCRSDADCSAPNPACSDGKCVECTESNVEQCEEGMGCIVSKNTCEQCKTDADCDSPTPACSALGECVQCTHANTTECENGMGCNEDKGICAECRSDADCLAPTPACTPNGECVECTSSNTTQCTEEQVCDDGRNVCVECRSDADCIAPTPACNAAGVCVECTSSNVSECSDAQVCNGVVGVCVDKDAEIGMSTDVDTMSSCACTVPSAGGSSSGFGLVAMLLGLFGLRRGRKSDSE